MRIGVNSSTIIQLVYKSLTENTPENFEKYMADIEIYVNGIAASQIHTLNSLVDFTRQQVMENYHPDENDFTQRELNACYVDEYEFFRNVIQSDLGEIIKCLRKSHTGDTETAPETSLAESMRNDIEAYKTLLRANTWSNNLHIMSKTKTDEKKIFYLKLASKEKYKTRELERQIDSDYYERLLLSDGKAPSGIDRTKLISKEILQKSWKNDMTRQMKAKTLNNVEKIS